MRRDDGPSPLIEAGWRDGFSGGTKQSGRPGTADRRW
jgi:hypothetical protein